MLIAEIRHIVGSFSGLHHFILRFHALRDRALRGKRVIHFAERRLNSLLVSGDLFLLIDLRRFKIGFIRAARKDRERNRRGKGPRAAAALEEVRHIGGERADRA